MRLFSVPIALLLANVQGVQDQKYFWKPLLLRKYERLSQKIRKLDYLFYETYPIAISMRYYEFVHVHPEIFQSKKIIPIKGWK